MAIYTLVTTGAADGHQHVTAVDFPHDATLIEAARDALSDEHTSIAVARGSGEDLEFVGVWDWNEGQPRWTAEE